MKWKLNIDKNTFGLESHIYKKNAFHLGTLLLLKQESLDMANLIYNLHCLSLWKIKKPSKQIETLLDRYRDQARIKEKKERKKEKEKKVE